MLRRLFRREPPREPTIWDGARDLTALLEELPAWAKADAHALWADEPWPWASEPGWQTVSDLDWRDDHLAYPPRGPRILPARSGLEFRGVGPLLDFATQPYRPQAWFRVLDAPDRPSATVELIDLAQPDHGYPIGYLAAACLVAPVGATLDVAALLAKLEQAPE